MSKQRATYYIGFMLLMSSLLMVVANNVPVLASFRWLWAPGFLFFSVISFKVFSYKSVRWALLYGFLFAGVLQYSLWVHANDWYKKAVLEDFYSMIVIVILLAILQKNNYVKEWGKLAQMGLVFFIITGIMTIVATTIDPFIVRASYSSGKYTLADYGALYKLGFGSYGYMTALIALFPILIYFYKENKKIWLSKRVVIILVLFFFFVLLKSQIFANILVAIVISILAWFGSAKFKRNIFVVGILVLVLMFIPNRVWVNTFQDLSGYFESGSVLNKKFQDVALFIDNPEMDQGSTTGIGERADRYPMLFKAFISQPFFGDASYQSRYKYNLDVGGHLYWMSHLALWGVFGFIAYILILKNIFKPVVKMFAPKFQFYYKLSLLSIVVMGLMKNLGGREPYIMLLIIIPGLYYLSVQEKR